MALKPLDLFSIRCSSNTSWCPNVPSLGGISSGFLISSDMTLTVSHGSLAVWVTGCSGSTHIHLPRPRTNHPLLEGEMVSRDDNLGKQPFSERGCRNEARHFMDLLKSLLNIVLISDILPRCFPLTF